MNAVRTRVSATMDMLEMALIAITVIQVRLFMFKIHYDSVSLKNCEGEILACANHRHFVGKNETDVVSLLRLFAGILM